MNIVKVKYEYEDELPDDITDEEYDEIFNSSIIDGVRLFPYVEVEGEKYFIVL